MGPSPTTPKRRCQALRYDGEPCRAWAVRPIPGRPNPLGLCKAHGGTAHPIYGAPVYGPAVHGDAVTHGAVTHGAAAPPALPPLIVGDEPRGASLYGDYITDLEFAALEAIDNEESLEPELRLVRVVLRRLFADFGPENGLSGEHMDRRALTMFKGAQLLARILQAQAHGLLPDPDAEARGAISQALKELAAEYDLA